MRRCVRLEAPTMVAPRDAFSVCGLARLAGVPTGRSTIAQALPALSVLEPHASALDLLDEPTVELLQGPLPATQTRRPPRREGTCPSPT